MPNKGPYGAEQGAVCSYWETTSIMENIPDSLGDIEEVETQEIIVMKDIMNDMFSLQCYL